MPGDQATLEIESFNLADLNVTALDVRLELTSMIPACTLIICEGNCGANCDPHCGVNCTGNSGCNCYSYN
jgi:hypothetical protein